MRRREMLFSALVIAVVAAFSTLSAGAQTPNQLVYVGWGGSWQKSLRANVFDPFQKATNIKVLDESGSSLPKLKSMVESGNVSWDVVDIIGSWLITGKREKLFDKLDLSKIDSKGYPPDSVFDTAVAIDTYTIGFAYNKDAFKSRKAPQTWADFWNTKDFPGRRALFDNPRYTLEFALMADGVPKDKLYPLDVDRAFKKLDELKPNVSFFFNQWEQSGQALADGSAQVAVFALARGYPMLRQGAPIQVVWNGGATAYDYLVIPKHAKNRDAAMTFITWYANNAKAQADMARDFPQGPVNPKGLEFLSPHEREQMSVAHLDETFVVGWEWWADNLAKIEERWNEWKLK